jgi:hypothetical protein
VDNLNNDWATIELAQNKLAIRARVFKTPTAEPSLEIKQACRPQAMTSFSAKPNAIRVSFIAHPLPLVFQPLNLDMSARSDAT